MPVVTANGIETFYESAGTGPALLLICGNGLDHRSFAEQVSAFSPHFRCISYDLRGVGQSMVPEPGYTIKDMALDARGLLDALGIGRAHIAGYSLGGAIAQEIVLGAPERVISLSLYSTFSHVEPYLRLRYDLLVRVLEECGPEIWAMFTAFSAFGESYINAHAADVEEEIGRRIERAKAFTARDRNGLLGHYKAILSHDALARLAGIRCPTWIAVGSSDPVTPVSYSETISRKIAGSVLRIFPGAPHRLLNFTADFNAAALEFLLRHR
jgi:pimeloyl-ACP methyl ester carboxylesterase